MGAGILPIALYRGAIYLLLGQERYNSLWSDFGGSSKKNEDTYHTAIREGYEELNGFLGNQKDLKFNVDCNLIFPISNEKYTSYLFLTEYNEDLPIYFNNNNNFIEENCKKDVDNKHNGLFEKKTIDWFTVKHFKNKKNMSNVRIHYREFLYYIIENEKTILQKAKKIHKLNYSKNY